jgi:hypothetical protein
MTKIIRALIFLGEKRFNISDLAFFFGIAWLCYHEEFWWYIPLGLAHFALVYAFAVARETKIGKEILQDQTNQP